MGAISQKQGKAYKGTQCKHLSRSKCVAADFRCNVEIKNFKQKASVPKKITWLSIEDASLMLNKTVEEIWQSISSGEYEIKYDSSDQLVEAPIGGEYRFSEAAKLFALSETALQSKIDSGKIKARYLKNDAKIRLDTYWEYEKCPLAEQNVSGFCIHFESIV